MSGWPALVATAVLGTERRTPDAAALPPVLRDAVGPARGPEDALLTAAAGLAVYRRAGHRLPAAEAPPPVPAPPDPRPAVRPAAAARLQGFLAGRDRELLAEWLAAVAARGLRVPPAAVPGLLDLATGRRELRTPVETMAGTVGAWLAAQHEPWGWAAPVDDPEVWRLGGRAARRRYLAARRQADPDAARAVLEAAWPQEDGDSREALLAALEEGLAPADEPLLEAALDDRRAAVRARAAALLARLPDSRRAARMVARLDPLVSWGGDRLVVALPADCPADWERDGIAARPPRGTGARAWWLQQLVAATPLAWWTARTGATPEALVALPLLDPAVVAGWQAAAVRQADAAWARALLTGTLAPPVPGAPGLGARGPGAPVPGAPGPGVEDPGPLLAVLDPDAREDVLRTVVAARGVSLRTLLAVLEAAPGTWSPAVSRALVDRLAAIAVAATAAERPTPDELTARAALRRVGARLAPELAEAAPRRLGALLTPGTPWARSFGAALDALTTRRAMLEEL